MKAQITECVFHNNLGGAIATSKVLAAINNCEFIENSAKIRVLYFYESANKFFFLGSVTIENNIKHSNGSSFGCSTNSHSIVKKTFR